MLPCIAPAQFARYQGGNNEPLWYHCCRVLEDLQYQKLADETLDELGQFFEDLGDTGLCPSDYDVSLAVSLYGLHSKGLHLVVAVLLSIQLIMQIFAPILHTAFSCGYHQSNYNLYH